MSATWSAHAVRRKGGHTTVVVTLDLSPLAGEQVAREIAAEARRALVERPALIELVRQAPARGDFEMPS